LSNHTGQEFTNSKAILFSLLNNVFFRKSPYPSPYNRREKFNFLEKSRLVGRALGLTFTVQSK
jgi:hypothetical protein